MRRYLQGTLDFACAIYAVINTLSLTHGLDLTTARKIFRETHLLLAADPALWADYTANNTDHYWLVRFMLRRWCLDGGGGADGAGGAFRLRLAQPFDDCLLPSDKDLDPGAAARRLPERHPAEGQASLAETARDAAAVWREACAWLGGHKGHAAPRALILRFHRFLPGVRGPVVSHWTTGRSVEHDVLRLLDASSEPGALLSLEKDLLLPRTRERALVRIVPESVILIEKAP